LSLIFWSDQTIESNGASCYDGGILEVSTDGGTTFTQVGAAAMLTDPYNGPIATTFQNPLSGLTAWCGDPQAYLRSVVDLTTLANQGSVPLPPRHRQPADVSRTAGTSTTVSSRAVPLPTSYSSMGSELPTTDAARTGTRKCVAIAGWRARNLAAFCARGSAPARRWGQLRRSSRRTQPGKHPRPGVLHCRHGQPRAASMIRIRLRQPHHERILRGEESSLNQPRKQ
jgi:hypothetical protein